MSPTTTTPASPLCSTVSQDTLAARGIDSTLDARTATVVLSLAAAAARMSEW
ncbi:hypothetical protein [Kibdelosporangium philippinense]